MKNGDSFNAFSSPSVPGLEFTAAKMGSNDLSRAPSWRKTACQGRRERGRAPGQLMDAGPLLDTGTESTQLWKFHEFQNMKIEQLFVGFCD